MGRRRRKAQVVRDASSSLVIAMALIALIGCDAANKPREPRTVVIESVPSGALIAIDERPSGQTPTTLRDVQGEKLLVVLEHEGYKKTAKMVRVKEEGYQRFVIEMNPLLGYISVDSKPQGAKVLLDGEEVLGQTPLVHKAVPVGAHKYEVSLDDYKPETNEIKVEADYNYTFMHELLAKEARLSVISKPSGAFVWINDEPRSDNTPSQFSLVPGDYTVQVYTKGFLTAEQNVTLAANEEKVAQFDLVPGDAPFGMVLVPGGPFIMGLDGASPDERPQREIKLPPFYIDKHEVTNIEYKKVFPNHKFPKGREMYPVTGISFTRANEYARAVGKRLPTEEEWEKAARGTDGREYPWGKDFDKALCNFNAAETGAPTKVGTYRLGVSPYSCLDMAGNAYEWTSTWYQAYPGNTDIQTEYGQVFRVLRGGSYLSDRFGVRCARRHYDRMDAAREDYGIRCAKDVESGAADPGKKP